MEASVGVAFAFLACRTGGGNALWGCDRLRLLGSRKRNVGFVACVASVQNSDGTVQNKVGSNFKGRSTSGGWLSYLHS